MEVGFQKGQSDNLPRVDSLMVAQYFIKNNDFTAAEIRGVKMKRSRRESYRDDAIGYIQLKREGNICTVKCRITPEHKVRSKPYHCVLQCNEKDEEILSISCDDCKASKGGCKHAVAFLMWLHRRTEEPSATSVKCYWKKSTLACVGTTLKYIKSKDFRKCNEVTITPNNKDFIDKIAEKIHDLEIDCQLSPYFKEKSDIKKMSMHSLICSFRESLDDLSFENFLNYCMTEMTEEKCQLVETATKAQANLDLWFEMRYGRVTASKAHEAAQCHTQDGTLVEAIFGAKLMVETDAMKRGKVLEDRVRKEVETKNNISIEPSGLYLNATYPFFGASPDGVTASHVIEIKCPSNSLSIQQDATVSKYYVDGLLGKQYLAQIQTQMLLTGKEKGFFCTAHADFEVSKNVDFYEVTYDKEYCRELFVKISKFWKECVFDKLIKIGESTDTQK